MLIPCEIAVKYALPYIRRKIADELMNNHHLTQVQAAKHLELDQSAISLYQQRQRGNRIDLESDTDIQSLIAKQANFLVQSNLDFMSKQRLICEVCKVIRSKGYLCEFHRDSDPTVDPKCGFCKTTVCPGFNYYLQGNGLI